LFADLREHGGAIIGEGLIRRAGAASADLRVPGAAAVANITSPLPRHPQRPARPTRASQPFAAACVRGAYVRRRL